MASLGVFFAVDDTDAARLKAAPDDEGVMEVVEEIKERWNEKWLYQIDKAWDALHRSLTDGTLDLDGDEALNLAVLGGSSLYEGEDYFVILKTPQQCVAIAEALSDFDQARLRVRYDKIDAEDYGVPPSEEDFAYTWVWFEGLADFYRKAASAQRHVIFTVDQ